MNALGWTLAALLTLFMVFASRRAGWLFGVGVTAFSALCLWFSLHGFVTA